MQKMITKTVAYITRHCMVSKYVSTLLCANRRTFFWYAGRFSRTSFCSNQQNQSSLITQMISSRNLTAASTFAGLDVSGLSEERREMTLSICDVAFVLVCVCRGQSKRLLTIDVTVCTGNHRSPASSKPYWSSPGGCWNYNLSWVPGNMIYSETTARTRIDMQTRPSG